MYYQRDFPLSSMDEKYSLDVTLWISSCATLWRYSRIGDTMTRKGKQIATWGIIIVLGAAGTFFLVRASNAPGKLDGFAQCLKDKEAVFYGAFWCSHCQNQKAMFGKSAKLLPYVECSTADGQGQLPVCTEKKITGYPIWEFSDGSRETGEVSLEKLSQKTGCPLPQ